MTDRPRVTGVGEIKLRLGVTRSRVDQLTHREDFPKPVAFLGSGRVWLADDVDQWISLHRQESVRHQDDQHPGGDRQDRQDH